MLLAIAITLISDVDNSISVAGSLPCTSACIVQEDNTDDGRDCGRPREEPSYESSIQNTAATLSPRQDQYSSDDALLSREQVLERAQ